MNFFALLSFVRCFPQITDSILVNLGRHQVANFFVFRPQGTMRISIFLIYQELWTAILLKLSVSTVRTGMEVISKFCEWEILVTQKIGRKISFFVWISPKRCGIFAFRLRSFTEVGGSTEWLQKGGDFLENFPPQGAEFF